MKQKELSIYEELELILLPWGNYKITQNETFNWRYEIRIKNSMLPFRVFEKINNLFEITKVESYNKDFIIHIINKKELDAYE